MWEYRHVIPYDTRLKMTPFCQEWQSVCWFMLKLHAILKPLLFERLLTSVATIIVLVITTVYAFYLLHKRYKQYVTMRELHALRERVQYVNNDMVKMHDSLNATLATKAKDDNGRAVDDKFIQFLDVMFEHGPPSDCASTTNSIPLNTTDSPPDNPHTLPQHSSGGSSMELRPNPQSRSPNGNELLQIPTRLEDQFLMAEPSPLIEEPSAMFTAETQTPKQEPLQDLELSPTTKMSPTVPPKRPIRHGLNRATSGIPLYKRNTNTARDGNNTVRWRT
ncbi:uncharacterized protein LOC115632095 [Scaptodrosophila lebanonensis]|uniref:Uncharacterized protein LOC115632095 n=1 Tax=Drosophila lebanonensis TaxID=7225 RepID=A0A6J2UCR3_DROLE|nr:uncharacterized protein LOC115632095 [Scaptodrosophila lebanonensis]